MASHMPGRWCIKTPPKQGCPGGEKGGQISKTGHGVTPCSQKQPCCPDPAWQGRVPCWPRAQSQTALAGLSEERKEKETRNGTRSKNAVETCRRLWHRSARSTDERPHNRRATGPLSKAHMQDTAGRQDQEQGQLSSAQISGQTGNAHRPCPTGRRASSRGSLCAPRPKCAKGAKGLRGARGACALSHPQIWPAGSGATTVGLGEKKCGQDLRPGTVQLTFPEGRQGSHVMCMVTAPHEVQRTASIQIGLAFDGDLCHWKSKGHPFPPRWAHLARCEYIEVHWLTSRRATASPHWGNISGP